MGIIDKALGLNKQDNEVQAEERQRTFLRNQQMVDVAANNEHIDYQQQEGRTDLLKWQQELSDELLALRHRLKGEVRNEDGQWGPRMILVGYDKETGEKVYERAPPLANDLFIDYVEMQVEPFLSRNMFSSNFTEKRILEMLKNTCNDISDAMSDGWDLYGIDFINYDLVVRLIKNVIIPGPFRAWNDGQRRHDRTVAKRIEAFNDHDQGTQRKKTLLGVNFS